MDITAKISLATAILELGIVGWVYFKFDRTPLSNFITSLIIFLGIYQLSEYMLCSSPNYLLWGKIIFIINVVTPILIVYHLIIMVTKRKNPWWVFIPAAFFIGLALIDKYFAPKAYCSNGLSMAFNNIFNLSEINILNFSYFTYLFAAILLIFILLYRGTRQTKNNYKKSIYKIITVSVFLALLLAIITISLFADNPVMYPSAINRGLTLFFFTGIICLYLEKKILDKEKEKNPRNLDR